MNYCKQTRVKNVNGGNREKQKVKKESEDRIVRGIEDRIIKHIKNLCQEEEDYYSQ